MSFFGSLFGQDSARYAQESSANAKNNLTTGYNQASAQVGQNRDAALGEIGTGYGAARSNLAGGYGAARNDLNGGIDTAKGYATDYLGRSTGYLNPWIQSGTNNQKILDDYSGANGTAAQSSMYSSFADQNNPLVAARNAKVAADAAAAANARGSLNGGRALLAATRTGQQMASQDLQNYINNVNTSAQRGYGASSQAASLTQQTGGQLADLEARRGSGLADLSTGLARGQADLSTGEANARAGIYGSQGNNLANLTSNYYNALAGNDVNLGSAQAQASQNGVNNMIGLTSAVMGGFTPGKAGISPFGNMAGGINNLFGGSSETMPGTRANGGFTTTTSRPGLFNFS